MDYNKEKIRGGTNIEKDQVFEHDPFVKEFLAFCKINGVEQEAIKLLDKKIKENRNKKSKKIATC